MRQLDQMTTPQWMAVLFGAGGGLGVAKMAHEHLRVEGVSDEERKHILIVMGSAALAGAAMYLLDVPKHYVVLDEETIDYWKQRGPALPELPEQWGTVP